MIYYSICDLHEMYECLHNSGTLEYVKQYNVREFEKCYCVTLHSMNRRILVFKVLEITLISNGFFLVSIISKNIIFVEKFQTLFIYWLCVSK